MQISVPEAVLQMDAEETIFSEPVDTEMFDALGVGPGLGQNETTAIALIAQLRRATCPLVIDADALNILSSHRAWMQQLPKNIIMTPHPKEFDRLAGNASRQLSLGKRLPNSVLMPPSRLILLSVSVWLLRVILCSR